VIDVDQAGRTRVVTFFIRSLCPCRTRRRDKYHNENERNRQRINLWERGSKHFRDLRAMTVCKMLEVSMLQRFELTIFVEIPHFSTVFVEKPSERR
jgi:hypothetical protein